LKGWKMPNTGVSFTRGELSRMLMVYERIFDCLQGSPALKGLLPPEPWFLNAPLSETINAIVWEHDKRKRYLPMPNGADDSVENRMRYNAYVNRAVWYNVPDRTLKGLVGQVFLRDPQANIPDTLDNIKADADGTGNSLDQVAKQAVKSVVAYGRGGFLVDYPTAADVASANTAQQNDAPASTEDVAPPVASMADIESGRLRPTIMWYEPWDIINWRTTRLGANTVLSLVVLRERVWAEGDDFELIEYTQYRVLRLSADGKHYAEIWHNWDESNKKAQGDVVLQKTYTPKNSDGREFDGEMPFFMVGAEGNTHQMQKAPLDDLCELAIGHFHNSADHEEIVFMVGQPTPVITGLSTDWVDTVLKGKVMFGSRAAVPLPPGGDMKLVEISAQQLAAEAMKAKEQQMVALGAKLVQEMKSSRTATETVINTTSESSVLANIADNVSDAIEWALGWCQAFLGNNSVTDPKDKNNVSSTGNGIKYRLNKDFDLNKMSAEIRAQAVKEYEAGVITWSEMRAQLRDAGSATLDDEEAWDQVQAELLAQPQPVVYLPSGADPNAIPPEDGKVPQPGAGGASGASGAPTPAPAPPKAAPYPKMTKSK
jgi:hypothetical protein